MIWGPAPPPSCGKWTALRKEHGIEGHAVEFWLLGYVSGYNMYGPDPNGGVGISIDTEGMEAFVDQYCTANPMMSLLDAADKLVRELHRRAIPQP
jgi:hypothetical protein